MMAQKASRPRRTGSRSSDPAGMSKRKEEKHSAEVNPYHHDLGREVAEQLLLGQGIGRPDQGGENDDNRSDREVIDPGEYLTDTAMEEKNDAAQEENQTHPLDDTELFPEDHQSPEEKHHRGNLDHDHRHPGRHELHPQGVRDVVPPQPEYGNQGENDGDSPSFKDGCDAVAADDEEREEEPRPQKPEPDDGEGVDLFKQDLENNGKNTPENGGGEGQTRPQAASAANLMHPLHLTTHIDNSPRRTRRIFGEWG